MRKGQNGTMQVVGAIIAGGKGSRLGGDKPLRPFRGATLLDAVVARVEPQVEALAINSPRDARFETHFGRRFALLHDLDGDDIGPLAGVLAGLAWAEQRGAPWLATFPADTPFLPRDLVARLLADAQGPVAAADATGLHGLCAVWPVAAHAQLSDSVRRRNLRSLREALACLNGRELRFDNDGHGFFNVNTPEDLLRAERMATDET